MKKKPALVATAAVIALLGSVAAPLVYEKVQEYEGYSEVGYLDMLGIPTKCFGDTNEVVVGEFYTDEECAASLEKQTIAHSEPVLQRNPSLREHPYALSAAILLAYNIGNAAYNKSSVARFFEEGRIQEGCDAIGLYNKGRVNGKLVIIKGLQKRRNQEMAICYEDVR